MLVWRGFMLLILCACVTGLSRKFRMEEIRKIQSAHNAGVTYRNLEQYRLPGTPPPLQTPRPLMSREDARAKSKASSLVKKESVTIQRRSSKGYEKDGHVKYLSSQQHRRGKPNPKRPPGYQRLIPQNRKPPINRNIHHRDPIIYRHGASSPIHDRNSVNRRNWNSPDPYYRHQLPPPRYERPRLPPPTPPPPPPPPPPPQYRVRGHTPRRTGIIAQPYARRRVARVPFRRRQIARPFDHRKGVNRTHHRRRPFRRHRPYNGRHPGYRYYHTPTHPPPTPPPTPPGLMIRLLEDLDIGWIKHVVLKIPVHLLCIQLLEKNVEDE